LVGLFFFPVVPFLRGGQLFFLMTWWSRPGVMKLKKDGNDDQQTFLQKKYRHLEFTTTEEKFQGPMFVPTDQQFFQ
jgi:hypothetical protein